MDYATFDKLCKANGTSATALALKLGLSKGNTTSWRKGGNPSADILIKIADELNCTVDVLLGRGKFAPICNDEDEKALYSAFIQLNDRDKAKVIERAETLVELATESAAKEQAAKKAKPDALAINEHEEPGQIEEFYIDLCYLPASAGSGVQLDENYSEPMRIAHTPIAERANYAVRVSGNSMEPEYSDGDIVLVETCPDIEIGEIGLFIVNDLGYIKERGEDRLISLNPKCPDVTIGAGDIVRCRGRVLGKAEIIK